MAQSALVIGGTGPTGPTIVHGLIDRGYEVTILHGGHHENPEIPSSVRDIHADPHFVETLSAAVADERFDLVIAQYGRLRTIVDVFSGRTERLVAIGAATGMAATPRNPLWGRMGRPALLTEERIIQERDLETAKIAARMAEAQNHLLEAHARGAFNATYLGYTLLYGPNQPGPQDWSVVRRILDGRRELVIADGGLKLETRGYSQNVAQSVLLAVDKPQESAGKSYIVSDRNTYTMKQRIDFIAAVAGHSFEFIDLPWPEARPAHPLWRYYREHRLTDSDLIRTDLGFTDVTPSDVALQKSIEWLIAHPLEYGGEIEGQIGDPFDYEREDALILAARSASASVLDSPYDLPGWGHQYRHPKAPGEQWQRPAKE
ncbi:MAG: NAD-dependent epimerase/dehydratase [Microbacteriaceae bacterium]|jgi:nucleoside-diphosphate-sugar epimerase|nr:NAD-dependent epimerase/dehydratase [Microbacteriaceae bacterium]